MVKALAAVKAIDQFDVLVTVGLGLVCYGVAHLYSLAAALIVAGGALLGAALIGLLYQVRRGVRGSQ